MSTLTWTKSWSSSDDGSPFGGADIQNIQSNITAIVNGALDPTNFGATQTYADGDYIDLSAIVHDDAALQGFRLPQIGTTPTSPTSGEGQIGWDQTNNNIEVYSGAAWIAIPTVASAAQGDVFYHNGTIWTRLGAGTAGQLLRTAGAGANPAWSTPTFPNSVAQGDVPYGSASNVISMLGAGTSGQFLQTQGAGANPVWALPADLSITSQAQGDILYFNGTNWVRLAAGTDGQVLETNGAGANPVWADSNSAWTFVETITLTGTSDASSTLPTSSQVFMLVLDQVRGNNTRITVAGPNTPAYTSTTLTGTTLATATVLRLMAGTGMVTGTVIFSRVADTSAAEWPVAMNLSCGLNTNAVGMRGAITAADSAAITSISIVGDAGTTSGKVHLYRAIKD